MIALQFLRQPRKALLLAAGLIVVFGTLAVVAIVGVAAFRHIQSVSSPVTPPASRIEALHAACVKDMIASTCKVMSTATTSSISTAPSAAPAKESDLVFIAGVGAVSALDYQQMYEAGAAMCSVVKKACIEDWTSGRCQTAKKLLLPGGGV